MAEASINVMKMGSFWIKINKLTFTKMKKSLNFYNINLLLTPMLEKNLMLNTSIIYIKKVQQLFKIRLKDSLKNSLSIISVWWPLLVQKVQTSITLKFLSCSDNKSFKEEESQWWSQVKPCLLLSPMIQILELQVLSVIDSWQA